VLETLKKDDLWCADRNFCTLGFLFGIAHKGAYFAIRQHANTPFTPLTEKVFIGKSETGKVYEQNVRLSFEGEEIDVRRIIAMR